MRVRILTFAVVGMVTMAATAAEPAAPNAGGIHVAKISEKDWKSASTQALQAGEIDRLIAAELKSAKIDPAPPTSDEQFIRRVYLDLTGKLPQPSDVNAFAADKDSNKRAKLIDKLLDSPDFATHWARYWRDVIATRLTDFRGRALMRPFERWLAEQFKENRSWDKITSDILTFSGEARYDDTTDKTGPGFFLMSRSMTDAPQEQAAETARVFLGIQINCAQCHDHPFDIWKRQQFHEFTAYFARSRPRPIRDPDSNRQVGLMISGGGGPGPGGGGFGPRGGGGEHRMPDKDNPRNGTVVHPKFLDGKAPARGLSDTARRKALVESMVDTNNPYFAGAFANRIWGELMGQSFFTAVDDIGPQKDAVFGGVITRLAGSFRGTHYDIKGLYRAILNTDTYQRQIRLGQTAGNHLAFAAAYPTRLRADALWDSLEIVLGGLGGGGFAGGPRRPMPGIGGRFGGGGIEANFKQEFSFDPSLKADDVEGSITQALLLMNAPAIQQRIRAAGNNLLGKILAASPKDADVLEALYLRTMARKPTEKEKEKCLAYIAKTGNRNEAFEDILWALINSTEFQTKR